jgi:hypothetical protein
MAVNTIKDPKALYVPPNRMIKSPITDMMDVIRIICFNGILLSSVVMYRDTSTELKKMATKSEDPSTTDKVTGK